MQIAYLLDNYTLLNQFTENIKIFIISKDFNPDRGKHNMHFLQVHANFALGSCKFCTNLPCYYPVFLMDTHKFFGNNRFLFKSGVTT